MTGTDFGAVPSSARTVAAFVVAFAGSVTLWWLYFDRAEEAARRVIAAASNPGRIARSAYTSCHIPMVAGVIATAAADELTIAHPVEEATVATTALILGGPRCICSATCCSSERSGIIWRCRGWSRSAR